MNHSNACKFRTVNRKRNVLTKTLLTRYSLSSRILLPYFDFSLARGVEKDIRWSNWNGCRMEGIHIDERFVFAMTYGFDLINI
jgi:hypothetical protein